MCRYREDLIPGNLRLKVKHYHPGNSSNNRRHGKPYMTEAKLLDRETGRVIGYGRAACSKQDSPRRTLGREIAVGRALKSAEMYDRTMRLVSQQNPMLAGEIAALNQHISS